jgi:hypothetical protein
MLRSMHKCVKSCERANGSLSDNFDNNMGSNQGEPLSPFFKIFFVNDMYEYFKIDNVDTFSLDDIQIFLLLFADNKSYFLILRKDCNASLINLLY